LLPEWLREPPSLWPWGLAAAVIVAVLVVMFSPSRRGPLITLGCICLGWEAMRWTARHFGIDLSDYRLVIYSLLLILTMILRPQGLFGVHEIWDYLPVRGLRRKRPAGIVS
jgi:ABC-type branched-subunit amino acid transport system permease subunit